MCLVSLASLLQGLLFPKATTLDSTVCPSRIYLGSEHQNSNLHACGANTLTMELPLHSITSHYLWIWSTKDFSIHGLLISIDGCHWLHQILVSDKKQWPVLCSFLAQYISYVYSKIEVTMPSQQKQKRPLTKISNIPLREKSGGDQGCQGYASA